MLLTFCLFDFNRVQYVTVTDVSNVFHQMFRYFCEPPVALLRFKFPHVQPHRAERHLSQGGLDSGIFQNTWNRLDVIQE